MPRNGSGIYVPPPSNPVSPGTVIESEWANDTIADISNALSSSLSYDGQTVPIANLPMGGFHHLNVSDAVARNQYTSLGQVQDGRHTRLQGVAGVDNVIATLPGGASSYVAGAFISFFAVGPNTGPMTVNYNGIGPKSLVTAEGTPLAAGAVLANDFVVAYYDGTVFRILSAVRSAVPPETFQLRTTGQERPSDGTYDQMTIATPTSINIPAGTAWIIPPGAADPTDAVEVSWLAQTIALVYLATSFTTTIAADINGNIVQFSGRIIGGALRNSAVLGVVEHVGGTANRVVTKPFIFGDDGYRGTDTSSLLTNAIISGGLVSGNSVSLMQMDIAAGAIFMPGGSANVINSPNLWEIAQQQNIPFRTLAGQNTLGAQILNAPVTQYDPNGAGVVTTIPANGDTVVHRLYYLYGSFIWMFGQIIYNSVENALSFLEYDRTKVKVSTFLQDATLVAEIISVKNASSLSNLNQAAIVAPGKINFSIGTPGGITEAPIDGTPYGRQNAGWVSVLRGLNPSIQNSAEIKGPAPTLNIVMNPYAAGTAGYTVWANTFKWFATEVTNPDDKVYFRSYNPATGALRHTITWDLATGILLVDGNSFVADYVVPFSGDIDTLTTTGFYRVASASTNQPIPVTYGYLIVHAYDGGSRMQTFTTVIGEYAKWSRIQSGGPWGPWFREYSHNSGAALVLDFNNVTDDGIYSTQTGSTNLPTQADARGVLVVARFFSNSTDYVTQEYTPVVGSGVLPPQRYRRVKVTAVWGPWRQEIDNMQTAIVADLNVMLQPGFYAITGAGSTNLPVASANGFLLVETNPNGDVHQTFVQGTTGNFLRFERVNTLLTWFAWNRIPDIAGAGRLSVVAALPGTPAADTIYFVTT